MKIAKIIVIGVGTVAAHCVKKLKFIGLNIVVIEYQQVGLSQLSQLCEKENIPFFRLNKIDITNYLLSVNEQCLIVSAMNFYLFPSVILRRKNFKIINFHNSLLPKYAGRNAEAWAIFMQEKESGITWHYVNDNVDGGDIICQKAITLSENITSLGLLKKQHILAASAFDEMLPRVLNGENGIPQTSFDPSDIHYAKDIPGNGILDIKWNSDKIYAFLRAMDYGPLNVLGSPSILIDGVYYTWLKYEIKKICYQKNRIAVKDDEIIITCADYEILLKKIRRITHASLVVVP